MAYADFSFYYNTFCGRKLTCEEFPSLAVKASAILDALTFNRIKYVTEDISMAMCAVAEAIGKYESSGADRGISSERIGDLSVSYRSNFASGNPAAMAGYKRAAMLFIEDKTLFYRGR